MSRAVPLTFPLAVEDGWPPVAVEELLFREHPQGYLLTVPPLFVKGLSVGDVVAVDADCDGVVWSWRTVVLSGDTTIWLLRMAPTDQIPGALIALRALGCDTSSLEVAGVHSIDVPASVPIRAVDAVLDALDRQAVAVAFPSMRHSEPKG